MIDSNLIEKFSEVRDLILDTGAVYTERSEVRHVHVRHVLYFMCCLLTVQILAHPPLLQHFYTGAASMMHDSDVSASCSRQLQLCLAPHRRSIYKSYLAYMLMR
jgi:hypothetical protein